jgi:hypothetical protein
MIKTGSCVFCGKPRKTKRKSIGERWYCCPEHHDLDKKRVRNEFERRKNRPK